MVCEIHDSNQKKRSINTNRKLAAVRTKTRQHEKPSPADAVHKHSAPIYISPSLFDNKRLKQKRLRWQELIDTVPTTGPTSRRTKKTERRQRSRRSILQSDVTIDLLTDDDEVENDNVIRDAELLPIPTKQQQDDQTMFQHFFVYQDPMGQPDLPHITLVPMSAQQHETYIKANQKISPRTRLPEPTIINEECIVLTDDEDATDICNNNNNNNNSNGASLNSTSCAKQSLASLPIEPIQSVATALHAAQVDEEVTVSLVPRSSTAGSCTAVKPDATAAEQVATERDGDETTVHTVIANRRYMFTLTKLREGLASGSVANFNNNGQQPKKASSIKTRRPPTTPPPAPISLKLSSELSISLISDDDEDDDANAQDIAQQEQLSAQKLLQRQPHLSVQQVPLPIAPTQKRRRKLGWR